MTSTRLLLHSLLIGLACSAAQAADADALFLDPRAETPPAADASPAPDPTPLATRPTQTPSAPEPRSELVEIADEPATAPPQVSEPIKPEPAPAVSAPAKSGVKSEKATATAKPAPVPEPDPVKPVPAKTASSTPAKAAKPAGPEKLAEVIALPEITPPAPLKSVPAEKPKSSPVQPTSTTPVRPATEPGYKLVLTGTIDKDLAIGPAQSPVLVRGNVVIAPNRTVTIQPGTLVHLRADSKAEKPKQPGVPDPTANAVLWVWGTLNCQGQTGNPTEFANQEKSPAQLLFYGPQTSALAGTRLRQVNVVQNQGVVRWENCELVGAASYALAGGAALFAHCSFKDSEGLYAAYALAPWSLSLRRSVFDNCREGIVLGSDPGESRLQIEQNHFLRTRGAHVRVLPSAGAKAASAAELFAQREILIGENWYGTPYADEVDVRIVDRRRDPAIRARLNIRPPAVEPYGNTGAGVAAGTLAASLKELAPLQDRFLSAHLAAVNPRATSEKRQLTEKKPTPEKTASTSTKPAEKPSATPATKVAKN